MGNSIVIRQLHVEVSATLEELAKKFKPGARLTLLVRSPESENGSRDMVFTDDDLNLAIEALRIRKESP